MSPARHRGADWDDLRRRLEEINVGIDLGLERSPAQEREILRARARELAAAPPGDVLGMPLEAVEFQLGPESYAFESSYVAAVFPLTELTRLPGTPPFVLGIIHLRGEIVSLVDLRRFFDLPVQGLSDLNKVLLLQGREMSFGVLADRVEGVRVFDAERLQPALPTLGDRRSEYVRGIAEGRVVVLDAAALLEDPDMIVDEEAPGGQER